MTTADKPLTKQDLLEALSVLEDRMTSNFREELDDKLAITEARITRTLMDHTEDAIAANNTELLSLISEVFQPAQIQVMRPEVRLRKLEKAAGFKP